MSDSADVAFELRGVEVVLGASRTRALSGLDLRIEGRERVALVGPSGAGKTTLLRTLAAAQRIDAGSVRALGCDPSGARPAELRRLRSRIGVVAQRPGLVGSLRVHQNVSLGRLGQTGLLGATRTMLRPGAEELEEIHAGLSALGVGHKLFARADRLSGGEAQRVAIARAFHQRPHALLLDEPVAAVDPARARDVLERTLELAERRGSAVVASLHDADLASVLFPRLLGLRQGALAFDGSPETIDRGQWERLYALDGDRAGD